MSTIILLILFNRHENLTSQQIPGFSSLAECQAAGAKIEKEFTIGIARGSVVTYTCR